MRMRAVDEAMDYPDWMIDALELEGDSTESLDGSVDAEPESGETLSFDAMIPDALRALDGPSRRRHIFKGFESSRVQPHGVRCRVTIALDGQEYVGLAEGPEVPGMRAEIAARATLEALGKAEDGRISMALQGARVLRVFDRPVAIVAVYGVDDRKTRSLIGASLVTDSVEQATVLATLQATNRWIRYSVVGNR